MRANLTLFVILVRLVAIEMLLIRLLNRRQVVRRREMRKVENVADLSMADRKTIAEREEVLNGEDEFGARAFEDVTDLENDDFIYAYCCLAAVLSFSSFISH